ncbi:hypothetical protein [Pararhizobium sp. DWP3-4]|uniref:hypothetical protein n=1 Tax=Pararhizobium sp. DWP3-4 TaxID=2804565 RepID=UPI003CF3BB7E
MSAGWPFNQVHHVIWRSKRFRSIKTSDDKLLLFWYMTSENQNSLGFFRCPDHWPAADLQWEVARVTESRHRLQEVGLIHYDEDSEELYVDQWLRFATKPAPKVFQGYVRQVESMESETLRLDVIGPALQAAEARWAGDSGKSSKPKEETDQPPNQAASPRLQASLARNGRGY